MRVLRYSDVAMERAGGLSGVVRQTTEALRARGHEIEVVGRETLSLSWCPSQLRRILVPFAVTRDIIRRDRRRRVDVVEIHEPSGAVYAVARRLLPGLPPLVVSSHGLEERHWAAQRARWRELGQRGPLKSRILVPMTLLLQARIAVRLADVVVVLSSADLEHLTRRGRPAEATFLVPNGVAEAFLRTTLADAPPPFRISFVGSWIDRKGVHELLDAWRAIHAANAAELVLAGTGSALDRELERLSDREREAVRVEPSVTPERLRELLGGSHALVLAGWFEGMPLSALEAMAAGVPVVLGDVGGNRDLLCPSDPENCGGLLVRPNHVADLRAVLAVLSEDEPRRCRLAQAARARAQTFGWDRTARGLEAAYRSAADHSSTGREFSRPVLAGAPAWPDADVETVTACPICAGALAPAGLNELIDSSDSAADGYWRLLSCVICGSASLSPRPTEESIGRAYTKYYTHGEPDVIDAPRSRVRRFRRRMRDGYLHARFGYTSLAPFLLGAALLGRTPLGMPAAFWVRHLRLPRANARLLDIGSGQGSQIRRMAALGWTASGIDFDPAAVAAGRRHGLDICLGDLLCVAGEYEAASFDAITFSHVIEHLYQPVETVRVAYDLLRADGRIWLATPNFASLGRHVAGSAWRGLEPPRHITVFTADGLMRLLRDAGFIDVRLLRCPPKERWYWEQSALIGARTGIRAPMLDRRWIRTIAAAIASILAALSPGLGDEMVVVARKP